MVQLTSRNSSLAILLLVTLSWGCQKKSAVVAPSAPETAPAPQVKSAPSSTDSRVPAAASPAPSKSAPPTTAYTASNTLEVGDKHFKAGNYRQAIPFFEAFLRGNPKSTKCEQALFYLGLSRALANDSSRNQSQADDAFRRLIKEFPKSQYRSQAELILGLHTQIERLRSDLNERAEKIRQLGDELQKLKQIDLQRRPTRPPN